MALVPQIETTGYKPTLLPSAFQVTELPLYLTNLFFNRTTSTWTQETRTSYYPICSCAITLTSLVSDRKVTLMAIKHFRAKPTTMALYLLVVATQVYSLVEKGTQIYRETESRITLQSISFQNAFKVAKLAIPMITTFVLGVYTTPYILHLAIISIVADIAIGAIEYLYHRYHKAEPKALNEIAFKKIVLSPALQSLFVGKLIIYRAEALYTFSKELFKAAYTYKLQEFFQAAFLERKGGFLTIWTALRDELKNSYIWFDQYDQARRMVEFAQNHDKLQKYEFTILTEDVEEKEDGWTPYVAKTVDTFNHLGQDQITQRLAKFGRAITQTPPPSPSNLLSNPTNKREAIQKYRIWSRQIHPDKNNNSAASTLLFKVLNEAYKRVKRGFDSEEASDQTELRVKNPPYALNFCRWVVSPIHQRLQDSGWI